MADAADDGLDKEAGPGSDSAEQLARGIGVHEDVAREMRTVETFVDGKNKGSLLLSLFGPQSHSSEVTAYVHWDGTNADDRFSYWDDDGPKGGSVKSMHAPFSKLAHVLLRWVCVAPIRHGS